MASARVRRCAGPATAADTCGQWGEGAGSRYPAGAEYPRRIARPNEFAQHLRSSGTGRRPDRGPPRLASTPSSDSARPSTKAPSKTAPQAPRRSAGQEEAQARPARRPGASACRIRRDAAELLHPRHRPVRGRTVLLPVAVLPGARRHRQRLQHPRSGGGAASTDSQRTAGAAVWATEVLGALHPGGRGGPPANNPKTKNRRRLRTRRSGGHSAADAAVVQRRGGAVRAGRATTTTTSGSGSSSRGCTSFTTKRPCWKRPSRSWRS